MLSHWEKLQESYNNAPTEVRDFVDGGSVVRFVELLDKSPEITRDLIFGCNLKILSEITDTELHNYISSTLLAYTDALNMINAGSSLFISENEYIKLSNPSINSELRKNLIASCSAPAKYLSSDESRVELLMFAVKKQIFNTATLKKYLVLVSDVVLGFYKIEDVVPLLQQELGIDARTAALLGADVIDFLAPLSDPNWKPPTEQDDESVSVAPERITETTEPSHEISAMNEPVVSVPTELPELRTMAADMIEGRSPVRNTYTPVPSVDVPVYVSTQPTIEKKVPEAPSYTAPLYEPPKPNVDTPLEQPRWG
ncbi:hypothetical protein K2P47_05090 [Patescibacteria group bacterium]|nr:hypothetical protein [Patescibacteria group bacterium]